MVWGGTPNGLTASTGVLFLDLDRGSEFWWKVEPEGGAPSRASGMMVYEPKRNRLVGGFGNSSAGGFPDLWSLDL